MSKSILSKEDQELWQAAAKGVRKLKQKKVIDSAPKSSRPHKKRQAMTEYDYLDNLSDHIVENVTAAQPLFFTSGHVPMSTVRDLKRGKFPINATLDLHGLTVEEARKHVIRFITKCLQHGFRYVCIIHGKGKLTSHDLPKLKNHVNSWLRQHEAVFAFCSALPRDGGTGAVYVLLRKGMK